MLQHYKMLLNPSHPEGFMMLEIGKNAKMEGDGHVSKKGADGSKRDATKRDLK